MSPLFTIVRSLLGPVVRPRMPELLPVVAGVVTPLVLIVALFVIERLEFVPVVKANMPTA